MAPDMTIPEFGKLVIDAADGDLKRDPLLRAAMWDVVSKTLRLGPDLVGEVLRQARMLKQVYALPRANKDAGGSPTPESPTPGDLLMAEQMARKLEPWAKTLRRDRFGSEDAPFTTIEMAADWIENESNAQSSKDKRKTDTRKLEEELDRAASKFAEETGFDVNVEIGPRILNYQRPDSDHALGVYATRGTFLYELARNTEHIAKKTGLTQDVLVVYVLAGLYPVRPRVWATQTMRSIKLPSGEHISTRWETLTFFAADLTYNDLRNAYADVRQYVGGKGTKGLDLEDVEFWRLVEYELGGPPNEHRKKTPFWKEAQHRWNSEYAAKNKSYMHYTRWESVRRKYKSLAGRLPSGF